MGCGLKEEKIASYLNTEFLGREIEIFSELDSTNNKAKLLAARGAPHGTLVIAESQSAGKGRLSGRKFYSPPDTGIYMSLIVRPEIPLEQAVLITPCAAVAVAEGIEALSGIEVKIKWVNDVLSGGKKLCGILTEAGISSGGVLAYAVLGIGINVNTKAFPGEVSEVATSVFCEAKKELPRELLIAEILNRLEEYLNGLSGKTFLPEYIRRSSLIGEEITVYEGNESYPAKAISIDGEARLVVKLKDGSEKPLNSGEVSVRPKL